VYTREADFDIVSTVAVDIGAAVAVVDTVLVAAAVCIGLAVVVEIVLD
jgi:hypothetical protein